MERDCGFEIGTIALPWGQTIRLRPRDGGSARLESRRAFGSAGERS
jgi:hypothetical protein